jgi:adenylate cyclase
MTGAGGQPVVLVVDDLPANRRLMEAILAPHGYHVVEAESGEDALEILTEGQTDLVLLDLLMPGLDGHETCKRIRANPDTAYLPVVMVTASGPAEKVRAIDTGADDFISKPLDQAELLGRVRSLLRVKRYHDTVVTQAAELAQWNEELEGRVAAQVRQLERFGALRRFFSPQITRLLLEDGDDSFLTSHRREITAVFCDLRGFTAFAETSDPEEVMSVLAA